MFCLKRSFEKREERQTRTLCLFNSPPPQLHVASPTMLSLHLGARAHSSINGFLLLPRDGNNSQVHLKQFFSVQAELSRPLFIPDFPSGTLTNASFHVKYQQCVMHLPVIKSITISQPYLSHKVVVRINWKEENHVYCFASDQKRAKGSIWAEVI